MKKIAATLFLLLGGISLFAQSKISISLTPDFGMLLGTINEFVYYVPNPEGVSSKDAEIRKLSELNWDVNCIPYLGARADLEIDTGMFLNCGFQVGLTKRSGVMEDRDWTNCVNYPDKNWLTNYSIHQNYLESYYNMDFVMGQKFSFSYGLEIKPELFLSNNSFSFETEKGWGLYGENWRRAKYGEKVGPAESGEKITWKSKVITYKQNRVFCGIGLGIEKSFDFGLSLSVFGKTRFAYVVADDFHVNTSTKYRDKPYGFGGILAGGSIDYSFNRKHQISLKGSYDWLPLILGIDSFADKNSDEWTTSSDCLGGASSTLYSASLSYTFTF